ncbi:class I SAM-dependent methyltransferase [Marinomonas balearica]|uniref:Methyltransferase family protein n=1 Tax=Marinomonas balearica TaxID=491947 RepID=A0A4R6M4T4_9GAMM|nr:class I SAM-dependent methyltransferase [Marinomonas balearica]TDO96244.1 methyltransferase family protein [Marinomonas balearica]
MDIHAIADDLDNWVTNHPWAKGGYVDPSSTREERIAYHSNKSSTNPIQQVREEILGLVEVMLGLKKRQKIVEIGFGEIGGTHRLFKQLFDEVHTIEVRNDVVDRHVHEQMEGELGNSHFYIGPSNDPDNYLNVCRAVVQCDALFIDGHHSRNIVESDWRMYHHLVREGGIIIFHDTIVDFEGEREVAGLVEDLSHGNINGRKHEFSHIHKSVDVGISYYIV